jgi:4-hydroxybenzoate polyprenyltransferase
VGMVPVGSAVRVVNRSAKYIDISSMYIGAIKDEFVYGGHLTALGSPILIICSAMLLNISLDLPILLIAYLIPLIVYSLDYYAANGDDAKTNPERALLISKKRSLNHFFIACYTLALILLLTLYGNISLIAFIIALSLCSIIYTVMMKDLTKKITGFKNIYTSFIWALGGTLFLPFYYSIKPGIAYVFIFLFMGVKSLSNVIFFDIKDIESDGKKDLKTIPIKFGKKKTLELLQVLNVLSFIPLVIGVAIGALPVFALALLALYFYTFTYLKKAEELEREDIRFASYALCEAEIILWPLLILAGSILYYHLYLTGL